jgi:hypothetical protein
MCVRLLATLSLLLFAPLAAQAGDLYQIWRYVGGIGHGMPAEVLLSAENGILTPLSSGFMTGSFIAYWESPEHYVNTIYHAPLNLNCRDLLIANQNFPIDVMKKRRILTEAQATEQLKIGRGLADDQVTFIEKLVDDPTLPDADAPGAIQNQNVQYFEIKNEPVRKTRKTISIWVVNGQANTREFSLPLETVAPIDRSKYKIVFELGRAALLEGDLESVMPLVSLEVLRQVTAENFAVNDVHLFAHAVNTQGIKLYRTKYAMTVVNQISDDEAILTIPLAEFLKLHPPETASSQLQEVLAATQHTASTEKTLRVIWQLRKIFQQGFDTAESVAAREATRNHIGNFSNSAKVTVEFFGANLRRKIIQQVLNHEQILGSARVITLFDKLAQGNGFDAFSTWFGGKSLKNILGDGPDFQKKKEVIRIESVFPEQWPAVASIYRQTFEEIFSTLRQMNINDPVKFLSENQTRIISAAKLPPSMTSEAIPISSNSPWKMIPFSTLWEKVKDEKPGAEPLIPSPEPLRALLQLPKAL